MRFSFIGEKQVAIRSILVIWDELPTRYTLVALLADEGYVAVGAASGQEALNLLANLKVDLITLDMSLPQMDGNAVLKN